MGEDWELCGDDAVSDNDTSGDKLIRSEKIAIPTENLPLAAFLHVMANGAVSQQPPAGFRKGT